MEPELQDVICSVAGFSLQLQQTVDAVGIQHKRFLADYIGAEAKSVTDEGIMCMVRGTD